MLKLFLISQSQNFDYDSYDSAVVIASSEEEARSMHPSGENWDNDSWCSSPEFVKVEYLGKSISKTPCVVCSSFNAG